MRGLQDLDRLDRCDHRSAVERAITPVELVETSPADAIVSKLLAGQLPILTAGPIG